HTVPTAIAADAAQYFPAKENLHRSPLIMEDTDALLPFQARAAWRADVRAVAFELVHPKKEPITMALVLKESAGASAWFMRESDLPRVQPLVDNYHPQPKPPSGIPHNQ